MNSNEIKKEIELKLSNEFGNYVEKLGVKHLFGRIWGLLMAQSKPISLKEIAEKLEVSKPAISTTIKIGIELGLIQKSYNPKMPREFFFSLNMMSMDMIIDPGLKKLDMFYQKIFDALKELELHSDIISNDEDLQNLRDTLYWLVESFKIIYDEYVIYGERVKQRISNLKENIELNKK